MKHIVIVEDDPDIGAMLIYHLEDLNYDTTHFSDGLEAVEYFKDMSCDLVLLDIMLSNYNGLDLCRELRLNYPFLPIMLLTSLDSETDRVVGLELGADDYLTKPFSMRECQARIKALLRRGELSQKALKESIANNIFIFEELSIVEDLHKVSLDGEVVELTVREFDLLLYFIKNKQKVFSRDELLRSIWGYSHIGYQHTVNTHINRI